MRHILSHGWVARLAIAALIAAPILCGGWITMILVGVAAQYLTTLVPWSYWDSTILFTGCSAMASAFLTVTRHVHVETK